MLVFVLERERERDTFTLATVHVTDYQAKKKNAFLGINRRVFNADWLKAGPVVSK